jgi:hypothetical protein
MDFLVEDVGESRLALGSVKIFEPGGWEIVERLVDATGGWPTGVRSSTTQPSPPPSSTAS